MAASESTAPAPRRGSGVLPVARPASSTAIAERGQHELREQGDEVGAHRSALHGAGVARRGELCAPGGSA